MARQKVIKIDHKNEDISESEESYYYKIANLPELPIDINRDILEAIVKENFEALKDKAFSKHVSVSGARQPLGARLGNPRARPLATARSCKSD